MTVDWKQLPGWLVNGINHRHVPLLATLIVMALLAWSAARVTWLVLPPPAEQTGVTVNDVQIPTTPRGTDPLMLSRQIASQHLLGAPRADNAPSPGEAIPETRLNLLLRGVAASSVPAAAFAIIADPAGKEEFYKVGDPLPGGAVLKEVHPQHIVLGRDDRFETLRLPQQALQMGAVPLPGTGAASVPPMPVGIAPDAGAALEQFRTQFAQDPQVLANLLQGEPFREGGQVVGYRVRPGRDAALFAKFGLQSGDVVTAVNGVSVADPQGRLDLMRSIGSTDEINVDLLRNGAPQSVTIPVGQ